MNTHPPYFLMSGSRSCVIAVSIFITLTIWTSVHAQVANPIISGIINQVNLDSLAASVRILSGEVGSKNGGTSDTIKSRSYGSATRGRAVAFLNAKLQSYGLSTQLQTFGGGGNPSGTNVLGTLIGTTYPGRKYIICAHYDDMPNAAVAPGADDNASGCAAVLEAARILSKFTRSYTLVFAFWDLEEIGLQGSQYYADLAEERRDTIDGVLNMEMFGWDADKDSAFEIHTDEVARSVQLADTLIQVDTLYKIGLKPVVYNPGTTSSDHAAFWVRDYSAVVFSQGYYGGDFNTSYHTASDRIRNFNLSYFHRCSKLGVGTFALLAGTRGPLDVAENENLPSEFMLAQNYPNPFNPRTEIRYQIPTPGRGEGSGVRSVRLVVYDILGREVAVLVNEKQTSGEYRVSFDGSGFSSGIYFYRLSTERFVETRRMLLLK